MAATGKPVVPPPIGVVPEITITADSLFERITPEEVWSCTSCKACDEICPVNIEILDKILDMQQMGEEAFLAAAREAAAQLSVPDAGVRFDFEVQLLVGTKPR